MGQQSVSARHVRFDTFELDLDTGSLTKEGRSLKLQPQPGKLLAMLVRERGTVVSREAIQNELWPAGTFVDFDQSINFCIRRIREVLDDDASKPRYMETVPRMGYSFLARVEPNAIDEPTARPETRAPDSSATLWKMIGAGSIVLLLSAGTRRDTATDRLPREFQ